METVFGIPVESMTLLKGGANNRVYLLNKTLIIKEYFQHPCDLRPRLDTEYDFLLFAWKLGLRQIPKPLMRDSTKALYTKVPGCLVVKPSKHVIEQAILFYLALNKNYNEGRHLRNASEAGLSCDIALQSIEYRLQKLEPYLPDFVDRLRMLFEGSKKFAYTDSLTDDLRLSPSDFGLHNILMDQGQAYFLDFEYAGWDDPAKTVCDFFTSPKFPIPKDLFWSFAQAVAKTLRHPSFFYERLRLHFPLSQIKWCCVILNIFLKTDEERRSFAKSEYTLEEQLVKANRYIDQFSMELPNGLC